MSTICGIVKKNEFINENIETIINSVVEKNPRLMKCNKIYKDETIELSNVTREEFLLAPFENNNAIIYFDGFIFNLSELIKKFKLKAKNAQGAILESYEKNILKQFLNKTNGEFKGSLYDKINKKVLLFTDRMGLGFIFYYLKDNNFAFSSRVYSLCALNSLDKTINTELFEPFIENSYLFGNLTFRKYIKLIKPASIIEYNILNNQFKEEHYWQFGEIKQKKMPFNTASKKFGKALTNAVKRRINCLKDYKIAIPISGGRDSRMIMAAFDKVAPKMETYNYTMGSVGNVETVIAQEVCKRAKRKHHIYSFENVENWFNTREKFLNEIDFFGSIQNIHGCEFLDDVSNNASISFSGYMAGEMMSDISRNYKLTPNAKMNKEEIKRLFGKYTKFINDDDIEFYDINKSLPYYYVNYLRRYGGQNINNKESYFKVTSPYLDNEVVELILSLDDKYLSKGLYAKTLYRKFPKFYKDIPWSHTIKTIDYEYKIRNPFHRITRSLIKKRIKKKYLNLHWYFINYDVEIRKPEIANRLKELLDPKDSIYSTFDNTNYLNEYLIPHLNGEKNCSNMILKIAGFEMYFRKVLRRTNDTF